MLRDKLKLALIASIVIAVCGILIYSPAPGVKAQGTLTSILIVGKTDDTAVATITFPEGGPGTTVSAPYNDMDGVGVPQVLDGAASEPVVRLTNTPGKPLLVWLEITGWTNGVVASEDYELVDEGTTTVAAVTQVLSADGTGNSVATGILVSSSGYKALYLEVVLGNLAGKSGTSTITILGE